MKKSLTLFLLALCTQFSFGQFVGSIEGVFNVSDLGAANYNIPIKIPQGINGLQPSLSLNYSSQGGNGILGIGWSLSGLSAITRVGKTIYNNSKVDGVKLNVEDNFALDGNRLILTSGVYGSANSTYRTEVETFKDIKLTGAAGSTNPESFEITDQNGNTYYYGSSFDSKVTMPGINGTIAWLLYQVKDLQGNTMQYTYAQSPGEEPRIGSIVYARNTNAWGADGSYVSFNYESKNDPNFSYVAGGKLTQSYKLTSISVKRTDATGTTKVVGSYELKYLLVNSSNPYTKLNKVIEKGNELNGTAETLPATEFTYGTSSLTTSVTAKSDLYAAQGRSYAVGDYNGDGLSDIIDYSTADGGSFRLLLKNQSSGFTQTQTGNFPNDFISYVIDNAIGDKERSNLLYFDYNGDGKSDLVRAQKFVNGSGVSQQVYTIYTSSGNAIENIGKIVRTSDASITNPNIFGYTLPFSGDFDGDGKSEILLLNTKIPDPNQPTPSPNNYLIGENYCTPVTTYGYSAFKPKVLGNIGFDASYLSSGGAKLYVVDYNGDGKSDILALWRDNAAGVNHAQTWSLNATFDANNNPVIGTPAFINVSDCSYPTLSHDIFTGDFNGDHITDYITFKNGDGWKIAYGKGNGQMNEIVAAPSEMIQASPYYPGNSYIDGARPIIIADFNGDGKDDIFDIYNNHSGYSSNSGANVKLFYSTGNNSFQSEYLPSFNLYQMGKKARNYWLGDFNGDGQVDFITKSEQNNNTPNEFLFRPTEARDLIYQVKDGLGAFTNINYSLLTNNSVYNNESSNAYVYPYVKKTIPIRVVSSVINDNGINTSGNTVTYSYKGLKYNAHGKGLLGFDNIRSYVALARMISEKQFMVNTSYAFPYLQASYSKYLQPNNYTEEILTSEASVYEVYHYGNKRIFPYQSSSQQNNGLTGEVMVTTNNYSFPGTGPIPFGTTFSSTIGKPFSITINKGNGLEVSTQTFSYPNYSTFSTGGITNAPVWVYSKPYKIATSNTCLGAPAYSRTSTFIYSNTTGLLTQTDADPGTVNASSTKFEYDTYGNPTRKLMTSMGLPDIDTRMTYDASHRFVNLSYNAAYPNIKSATTFDPFIGTKLAETTPDGFVNAYTYDGFGRIKMVTDNNGLITSTTYTWGSSIPGGNGNVNNGKYYITESANTGEISYNAYDRLNRKLKSRSKNFQNQWINTDYIYNQIGQIVATTKPYFNLGNIQNITEGYDAYGRQIFMDEPTGMTTFGYSPAGNNYLTVTTTNAAGQVSSVKTDASGRKVSVTDAGNNVLNYKYYGNGNIRYVAGSGTNGSAALQVYYYDNFNHLTERNDPNYGSYKYTYNAYGQTITQIDPKNQSYSFKYDAAGRMYKKTGPEGDYFYNYENNTGANCGKMISLTGPEGSIAYDYGLDEKVNSISYNDYGLSGLSFPNGNSYSFTYDNFGKLLQKTFPTGASLSFEYAPNGDLSKINNANNGVTFYEKTNENALGQVTSYKQQASANVITNNTYDSYTNLLTGQKTTANASIIRDMIYNFDPATGNLLNRKDNKYNLSESFSYSDNLNRLTGVTNANNAALNQTMNYYPNGNILKKTDVSDNITYDQANRVSSIEINTALPQNIPHATQQLTYTPFDKISTIDEGNYHTKFHYWPDGSRIGMTTNGSAYKLYAPDVEVETTLSGNHNYLTYVNDPDGNIIGIIASENYQQKDYFVLTDHLGSVTQVTDINGNIVEEKSYDAWGRLRNPQSWEPYASNIDAGQPLQHFERGYTGHEHLPYFGIINMNGRLYDPVMGRMFSPDVNIIGADNFQGYNRYTYALNNPLKFTDPSGDNPIIVAMAIGAAISALSYTAQVAWSDGGFSNWNWGQFGFNIGLGAAGGAMSFGIGTAFGSLGTQLGGSAFLNEAARASAHGLSGFILSGGKVSGFASGAFGSLAGSAGGGIGGFLNTGVGGTLFSAGIGGVASEIGGGGFWQGATMAAIGHITNQTMHEILRGQLRSVFDNYPMESDGNGGYKDINNNEAFARVSPAALQEYKGGNACATRLSLAFAKAGVKIPAGYGGIRDTKGNRIITSAAQMSKFLTNRYGFLIGHPTQAQLESKTLSGIYIMTTAPGYSWSGHVTKVAPNFTPSSFHFDALGSYKFWNTR